MHKLKIFLIITLLVFIQVSCNTTDPKVEPELLLKLEDVSCTEAWLQLSTNNIQLPATINLLKNNSVAQTLNLSTTDSLLYIDSLLPNQNYSFQVSSIQSATGGPVSSNKVPVTTLDTTSHNFTWQTFTFGQHQHSVLYDVAVIDENNIWAVGAIYMNDSLGNPDPTSFNAVHWDGQHWELKKIGGIGGWACHTVFAFSANDIWFEGTIHWDGASYNVHKNGWPLMPNGDGWQVNRMWGSNSNDLYAVGNNGNIAYYNGTSWTKLESGTTVNLNDVWGNADGKTGWACGYTDDYGTSALIKIKDGVVEKVFEGFSNSQSNGYYVGPMSGVWSDNVYRVFLMNWGGIYLQQNNNQFYIEKEIARFSNAGFGMDGTAYNNIFACGVGFVGHWNGYTYQEYPELFQQQRTFKSVKANTNIVCAVGMDYNSPIYSNAVIVLGK
ncbi:MAG TPA: glucosyl transferase [Ignavibacteriales bacterium]|nr:glucosyl transferase [Ignavibacteriales bacterium]